MSSTSSEFVDPHLTIREISVLLRCSRPHVRNLLAGKIAGVPPLAHVPLGTRKLIRKSALEAWIVAAERMTAAAATDGR
jgi:excisionase family DNA binding protein